MSNGKRVVGDILTKLGILSRFYAVREGKYLYIVDPSIIAAINTGDDSLLDRVKYRIGSFYIRRLL